MEPTIKKWRFLDWFMDFPEPRVTYLTKPSFIDRIIEKSFLRLLPKWVTPNQITRLRFFSIPVIAFFFITNQFLIGTILFLIAALSDALDGALARTRDKITSWGMLYDPLADKLLIGVVSTIVVSKYLSSYLALTIVVLELFLVSFAYLRYKGKVVPAKTMGKLKMILQCLGIIFLLFSILLGAPLLMTIAYYTLILAVIFAILSLTVFRSI
jgi:CDP-diacylglycerol--glycerol-3-phosphate 3-phosphatidyltransferase